MSLGADDFILKMFLSAGAEPFDQNCGVTKEKVAEFVVDIGKTEEMIRFGVRHKYEIHPGKDAVVLCSDCAAERLRVRKVELVAHRRNEPSEESVARLKSRESRDRPFVGKLGVFSETLAGMVHVASELGLHVI